jgi:beta-lactamase regulating signal transducer with metallopeptidase domain
MNLLSLTTHPGWTAAGWTMLHLLWVGTAIGVVAGVGRWFARRARAEVRYAIGLGCLAAMLVAAVILFAWVYEAENQGLTATGVVVGDESGIAVSARAAAITGTLRAIEERRDARREMAAGLVPSIVSRLEGVVGWLPWLWVIGAPMQFALFALGLAGVERLRRSSCALGMDEVLERCQRLAGSLGIVRRVGVAVSDRIVAPILVGIVRPMILLPPAALSGWSADELEMALLHELAHLKRWDNLVNLLQRLVEALLFFHPVVWWISGWIRLERELCCDAVVVNQTGCKQAGSWWKPGW